MKTTKELRDVIEELKSDLKIQKDAYEHLHQTNADNFKKFTHLSGSKEVEVSDEEIEKESAKWCSENYGEGKGFAFIHAAKWMRDKLKHHNTHFG